MLPTITWSRALLALYPAGRKPTWWPSRPTLGCPRRIALGPEYLSRSAGIHRVAPHRSCLATAIVVTVLCYRYLRRAAQCCVCKAGPRCGAGSAAWPRGSVDSGRVHVIYAIAATRDNVGGRPRRRWWCRGGGHQVGRLLA